MPVKMNACLAASLALLLLSACAFTPPESRNQPPLPPTIDKVLPLPPISVKLKGLTPKQAIAALSHDAGITIVPAKFEEIGHSGPAPLLGDIWRERAARKLDFDLEGVSYWQALDRIMQFADLHPLAIGNNWMTVHPMYFKYHFSFSSDARVQLPYDTLEFQLDPRVRLCRVGQAVIQTAQDNAGHDISAKAAQAASPTVDYLHWDGGMIRSALDWPKALTPGTKPAELSGYLPVSVVTARREVEHPLRPGTGFEADGWNFELLEIGTRQLSFKDNPMFMIGVELCPPADKKFRDPIDLRMLVEVRDHSGAPLKPRTPETPSLTKEGGVRQVLYFYNSGYDQETAAPETLIVDIPTEIKEASIPFTFHDVHF